MKNSISIKKSALLLFLLLFAYGQEILANTNIPGVGVVIKRNPGGGASLAGTTNQEGTITWSIKEAGDYTITLKGTQGHTKGLPVKGATVKCGKPKSNLLLIGSTNEKGELAWKDAKPGNYTLQVAGNGDQCPDGYVLKEGKCRIADHFPPDQPQAKTAGNRDGGGNGTTVVIWARKSPLIFLGGGIVSPGTSTGLGHFTDINLSTYIPIKSFNKWSIGLDAGGSYNFSNKDNCPEVTPFQVMNQMVPPVVNEKGNGQPKNAGFRIAAGPAAVFAVSDNFMVLPSMNAVYSNFKESNCMVTQTSQVNGITYNWDIAKHSKTQSSGIGFMPKLKLVYLFGRIGLWAEGSYMMAQKTITETSLLVPEGTATNGSYDWGQMNTHTYNTSTTSTAFKALGFGGGIVLGLGKHQYRFGKDDRYAAADYKRPGGYGYCPRCKFQFSSYNDAYSHTCLSTLYGDYYDHMSGSIAYYAYDENFPIDNPELTKILGVRTFTIRRGIYAVEPIEGGRSIVLPLLKPVRVNKAMQKEGKWFKGTSPKGHDCKTPGNTCFYTTENKDKATLQEFLLKPVIEKGFCTKIEIQYKGSGSPKNQGF